MGINNFANRKAIMENAGKTCTRCVMDTTDPDIHFDSSGECNHCRTYDEAARQRILTGEQGQQMLSDLVGKIKEESKGKDYDCIIGVSGGVDSSYVAYLTKKLGLRPLAVHVDNGWDSELAVSNIKETLTRLGIDLHTEVLDWEEFKDLQLAFLKASVPDVEVPTDHTISAVLYEVASREGVKYIISGGNVSTEGVLPARWAYGLRDWKYIKGLHRQFGNNELKSYKHYSLLKLFDYVFIKRIRVICLLNFYDYKKKETMEILEKELNWRPYTGKHHESIITRFLQSYILPRKFNVDKRKAHLSTLICSGQLTREEAMEDLQGDPYLSEDKLREEKIYVAEKFSLTEDEFDGMMALPIKSFLDYPSNYWIYKLVYRRIGFVRKLKFP